MDIKAYIRSGIIESYVLGLASDDEISELEKYRIQYPELNEAIDAFAVYIEEQSLQGAIEPPPAIKDKVLTAIKEHNPSSGAPTAPVVSASPVSGALRPIRSYSMWKAATAASVIFLISSGILNFYLYSKYKSKSNDYQALLTDRNTAVASNQVYQTKLAYYQRAEDMMANPDMKMIKLPDVKGKNDNFATVLWNTKDKAVYLIANRLPKPEAGKQFQLWALVDGKPVDAGVIDPNCHGACTMKKIPKAQAFAITLEKQGGSEVPTLSQLFVMGNV